MQWVFIAAHRLSLVAVSRGYSLAAVSGLLIAVASLLAEHNASLMAQMVKNLPTMWETWVRSLHQEYPLEKEMATHFSILAWRIPWTGWLQSMELQRVGHG